MSYSATDDFPSVMAFFCNLWHYMRNINFMLYAHNIL